MSRWVLGLVALAFVIGAWLRYPGLEERPLHNDEAVNAIKFGRLWEQGQYKYDPNEHHGPSLYYATLAFGRLTGGPIFEEWSEKRLRLVAVLFGLGLILVLPLVADGLGRAGTVWAGLFTAVSPAFVFYSRYFIHEMLLVFFAFLALAAGWRYWRTRNIGRVLLAGAALGLMSATKETFVITLAAAALAVTLNQIWNRLLDASGPPIKAPRINSWHVAAGFGVWLAVAFVLFSSFFTNASGPADSLRTYDPWIHRAGGDSPHVHPWYFYFQRLLFFHPSNGLIWTEAIILLLAVVATVAGFRRRWLGRANPSLVRFLAFYTFLLTGFYCCIGYKTPWCLLNFWHGMILLAGVGAGVAVRSIPWPALRVGVNGLLLLGAGHLAWQAWRADTEYAADARNPYVYAQTSPDILDLVNTVEALAKVDARGHGLTVQVVAPEGDYWPLPWYLRHFKSIGWYDRVPEDLSAPVIIMSPALRPSPDQTKTHMLGFYGLRPQVRLVLFIETALWDKWLASQNKSGTTAQVK